MALREKGEREDGLEEASEAVLSARSSRVDAVVLVL